MFSALGMASSSWAVQHQTAQSDPERHCQMLQLLQQHFGCKPAVLDRLGQLRCHHNAAAGMPVQQPASWQVMLKVEQWGWCQHQACECMPMLL